MVLCILSGILLDMLVRGGMAAGWLPYADWPSCRRVLRKMRYRHGAVRRLMPACFAVHACMHFFACLYAATVTPCLLQASSKPFSGLL